MKGTVSMHKVFLGLALLLMIIPALAMMEDSDHKLSVSDQGVLKSMPKNLTKFMTSEDTTYVVIPPTSGLNYKIMVFDIREPLAGHYHEHQTQDIMVLDGKLKVQLDDEVPMILESSGKVQILPKVWHVLEPVDGPVRYISTYFFNAEQHPTGLPFPEDVNFTRR